MRIDVHKSNECIASYTISDISMLTFDEWREQSEIQIPLDQFIEEISKLNFTDPVTNNQITVVTEVDFYLPPPVYKRLLSKPAPAERQLPDENLEHAERSQSDTVRV